MRRKYINPNLGMEIEAQRREKGLSQEELAGLIGISRTQMGRLERGENLPSEKTLRNIEEALELQPYHLEEARNNVIVDERVAMTIGGIKSDLSRRGLSEKGIQIVARITKAVADAVEDMEGILY